MICSLFLTIDFRFMIYGLKQITSQCNDFCGFLIFLIFQEVKNEPLQIYIFFCKVSYFFYRE